MPSLHCDYAPEKPSARSTGPAEARQLHLNDFGHTACGGGDWILRARRSTASRSVPFIACRATRHCRRPCRVRRSWGQQPRAAEVSRTGDDHRRVPRYRGKHDLTSSARGPGVLRVDAHTTKAGCGRSRPNALARSSAATIRPVPIRNPAIRAPRRRSRVHLG